MLLNIPTGLLRFNCYLFREETFKKLTKLFCIENDEHFLLLSYSFIELVGLLHSFCYVRFYLRLAQEHMH